MVMPVTISPTASVTISGFSPTKLTSSPLTSPTPAASAMQMTIAPASPLSLPLEAPTTTLATRTITPGIERSMPPFMITSISPRAATARKVMKGSTALLSDADDSASGATIWQTTSRKAVASQTPTKPEPGSALLRSSRSFRFRSLERDPSRGTGAAVTFGCLAHPLGSKLLPRCRQILNTACAGLRPRMVPLRHFHRSPAKLAPLLQNSRPDWTQPFSAAPAPVVNAPR